MPEVEIVIGGRSFEVACQNGEEHYLQSAAKMLDAEAQVLASQIGRMPEGRMLLMAGLMLADKTAGLEDRLREADEQMAMLTMELRSLREAASAEPERIEVVPEAVTETLSHIAARAEALASDIEERVAG